MRAIVEIKGGFGNQIFQYSFANFLKTRGYKVKVNINKSNTQRFPLDSNFFGFQEAGKYEVSIYKFLYFISQKNFLDDIFKKITLKIFIKENNLDNFLNNNNKCLFNHFDGYWQNINLIKDQKNYLIDSLSKIKVIKPYFKKKINAGTTLVHVRRGDYVNVRENLDVNFYEEAIGYCKKRIKDFSFEVFTDDVAWVRKQQIFKQAKAINGPKDNIDDLLIDVAKMFNFENFIIGNSTFSLIPALLTNSKKQLVIVADPWMKNSKVDLKFERSWVKIRNI